MFNYKRIGAFLVFLIIAYCIWIAIRPAKIVRVDNSAVFVEHLPMTTEGKLNWWLKNRELLESKYHIINTPDNFTVIVMNFGGYEKLPTGTRDGSIDDYTCFDDTNGEHKKCIYNSIALVVRGNLNGKVFITIDGKTYLQTDSDKAIIYKG
ncbi:DUF943 family protein [Pantoea ananatis]|uniref:DUF943 family protein n=1 Tax=Pantoea ananas TaxID=553 RepID=UPI001C894021|nr:DUF943 family protein [Pantoea ananatis]QZE30478.1 DUF943 family protein [Pantoea ananatis]BEK80242.1 DUF943 family protein [Enterobacter asburiae]HEC5301593.1 DUF943 family protein [Enterobacter asburiae]